MLYRDFCGTIVVGLLLSEVVACKHFTAALYKIFKGLYRIVAGSLVDDMPSFSIEVPGESNPLTENILVNCLSSAASTDPTQIQTGTKQLQQWETTPGYYRHLQSAYLEYRLPVEIRYLAIIQLKNGIDKYWRKTALK